MIRAARSRIATATLAAAFALAGAPQAAERPVPVSCLYLHGSVLDERPGKRAGRAEIHGSAIVPSLDHERRGTAIGDFRTLVILINWADQPSHPDLRPPSHFDKIFFQTTSGGNETMLDYYLEVSDGRFGLDGSVTVWLRSTLPYTHYVNGDGTPGTIDDYGFDTSNEAFIATPYPANVWGIVREAVELADAAGIDFTQFDNDGPDGLPSSGDDDGIVDAVIVIHAGTGAEQVFDSVIGPSQIWSHKSDLNDPLIVSFMGETIADGVRIGPYNLVPEIGQVGVYAHEFGHILGLPDLYRTFTEDNVTIQESTIGTLGIMDAGSLLPFRYQSSTPAGAAPSHFNPFFKSWLGWLDPEGYEAGEAFDEGPVAIDLDPIERGGSSVRLLANPGGVDWSAEKAGGGEYFLLENRGRYGFDRFLPGSGLLVWHVNEARAANDSSLTVKRLLVVVEAEDGVPGDLGQTDPYSQINLGEADDFWPTGTKNEWTPETSPSTDLYGGRFSGVSVTSIVTAGDAIQFDLDFAPLPPLPAGTVTAYPNPFRPAANDTVTLLYVPASDLGDVETVIRLYDIGGTAVRTLPSPRVEEGTLVASWDGKNDGGHPVASGVYLFVLTTGNETKTGKIALLR